MEVAWIDRKSLFEDRQKLTRYEIRKERIKDVSKTWDLRHLSNWKGIKDLFRESVDLKTRNFKKKRKKKSWDWFEIQYAWNSQLEMAGRIMVELELSVENTHLWIMFLRWFHNASHEPIRKIKKGGAGKTLSGSEHLVSPRMWVWFPAPTRYVTVFCSSNTRGPNTLFRPPQAPGPYMRYTRMGRQNAQNLWSTINTFSKRKWKFPAMCLASFFFPWNYSMNFPKKK